MYYYNLYQAIFICTLDLQLLSYSLKAITVLSLFVIDNSYLVITYIPMYSFLFMIYY